MLTASCHCGAVSIEMARRPRSLTQCNCSICRRYGAWWAYCSRKTATVHAAGAALGAYSWSNKRLVFYHCRSCGCLTHYASRDTSREGRIAVNARMLPREVTEGIRMRTFDGAGTFKYID